MDDAHPPAHAAFVLLRVTFTGLFLVASNRERKRKAGAGPPGLLRSLARRAPLTNPICPSAPTDATGCPIRIVSPLQIHQTFAIVLRM